MSALKSTKWQNKSHPCNIGKVKKTKQSGKERKGKNLTLFNPVTPLCYLDHVTDTKKRKVVPLNKTIKIETTRIKT